MYVCFLVLFFEGVGDVCRRELRAIDIYGLIEWLANKDICLQVYSSNTTSLSDRV